jgi:hypothetical protein
MFDREHHGNTPVSWLHIAGFVLVLWMAASEAMAQVRELVVTEVRGNAVRSTGNAQVRTLDSVKVGDRIRLSSDSHIGLFSSADAQLYLVDGPAEVAVGPKGVTANGKPATVQQMREAYRGIRANPADLVQGSLVMRSIVGLELQAPEGLVSAQAARQFTWIPVPGVWRFELSTDAGELVHRAETRDGKLVLPAEVALKPGIKYVWGIAPPQSGATPADWTEFAISDSEAAQAPPADAAPSERVLYAAWLVSRDFSRAATRVANRPIR